MSKKKQKLTESIVILFMLSKRNYSSGYYHAVFVTQERFHKRLHAHS